MTFPNLDFQQLINIIKKCRVSNVRGLKDHLKHGRLHYIIS